MFRKKTAGNICKNDVIERINVIKNFREQITHEIRTNFFLRKINMVDFNFDFSGGRDFNFTDENNYEFTRSTNKKNSKFLEEKSKPDIYSEIQCKQLEMYCIERNLHNYMSELKTTNSELKEDYIINKIVVNRRKLGKLKNNEKLLEERLKVLLFFEEQELKNILEKVFIQNFYECKSLEKPFKDQIIKNLKYYLSNSTTDYENIIEYWVELFLKYSGEQYVKCKIETELCKKLVLSYD